jgi:phosphoglycolate phosphatase-like HAD superfamily hydrolase
MTVLFWDIDGTLITTGRAGMIAWNQAVRELTGREFDLKTEIRTAGFTDHQIAVRTFETLGLDADADVIARFVARYEELLPSSLPLRQGRVLDNVLEILDHLRQQRPDVRSFLLTGNTRGGARAKLTYYGLADFFCGGAFCEDAGERARIAQRALTLARNEGLVRAGSVFVVGDTPHDIDCAKAIGARTIAVATGGYSLAELLPHRPWRLFETLPPPHEFTELIDLPPDTEQGEPLSSQDSAHG